MIIFHSEHPPIKLPTRITVWDWVFDSPAGPLGKHSEAKLAGFLDAETKERLSYKDVKEASTYVSTALVKKYGFQEGQTLALFSPNSIWYPVAMSAGIRVGGYVSGASPAYNVEEMAHALKVGKAKLLVTSVAAINVAVEAAELAGIHRDHIFLIEGKLDGFKNIQDLVKIGKNYGAKQVPAYKIPQGLTNKDVCGFLSFTSGTTGLPKAAMISHQNVIAQCLQIMQITPPTHKKVLAVVPSYHITGLVHILHMPIMINAEVIMLPSFSMKGMLQAVQDYQIEELLLVPPILIRMVRDSIVDKYDLSCVKRFSSGAAPLSDEILHLLAKKFPQTGFKQGYGMTESCSCISAHPPKFYDYKYAHTAGTLVASTDIKLVNEDGKQVNFGVPGEIYARGPQIVMGYLDNPKATLETFTSDGWLRTGDQGVLAEDGTLTIVDRLKEMIKVKGIGVAPAELEDLLLGHDKVEDVAILGIHDDYSGEVPKAYVVLKDEYDASLEIGRELMEYVVQRKVRHKWIKEIEFTDAIPKSAAGKILRRVLRDKEKAGESTGVTVRAEASLKSKI